MPDAVAIPDDAQLVTGRVKRAAWAGGVIHCRPAANPLCGSTHRMVTICLSDGIVTSCAYGIADIFRVGSNVAELGREREPRVGGLRSPFVIPLLIILQVWPARTRPDNDAHHDPGQSEDRYHKYPPATSVGWKVSHALI